jgi:hypothetical protein
LKWCYTSKPHTPPTLGSRASIVVVSIQHEGGDGSRTTFNATDPTIGLVMRLRAWPSGQRAAVAVTAKESHFCKC